TVSESPTTYTFPHLCRFQRFSLVFLGFHCPRWFPAIRPSPYRETSMPNFEPLAIGVCSWSLQVKSIPELAGFLKRLGIDLVQIACGDPHHAAWDEGDAMPAAAKAAG